MPTYLGITGGIGHSKPEPELPLKIISTFTGTIGLVIISGNAEINGTITSTGQCSLTEFKVLNFTQG